MGGAGVGGEAYTEKVNQQTDQKKKSRLLWALPTYTIFPIPTITTSSSVFGKLLPSAFSSKNILATQL